MVFCCRPPCARQHPWNLHSSFVFYTQANTELIRNNRANLSDILDELSDGKTEPTGRRASFISPFSTNDVKNR